MDSASLTTVSACSVLPLMRWYRSVLQQYKLLLKVDFMGKKKIFFFVERQVQDAKCSSFHSTTTVGKKC